MASKSWEARVNELKRVSRATFDVRNLARTMVDSVRRFPEVFKEGTTEEKREFVQLLIEKVVLNAGEKKALVSIRRFPAVETLPGIFIQYDSRRTVLNTERNRLDANLRINDRRTDS
jgi:hypothetical protein